MLSVCPGSIKRDYINHVTVLQQCIVFNRREGGGLHTSWKVENRVSFIEVTQTWIQRLTRSLSQG